MANKTASITSQKLDQFMRYFETSLQLTNGDLTQLSVIQWMNEADLELADLKVVNVGVRKWLQ